MKDLAGQIDTVDAGFVRRTWVWVAQRFQRCDQALFMRGL
jgi:hypothetical protein